MYSGGRDRKIYCTDLRNPDLRELICEEKAPILKVSLSCLVLNIAMKSSSHVSVQERCSYNGSDVFSVQMELDKSADPPQAIWVSTTKSIVNKWVSYVTQISYF